MDNKISNLNPINYPDKAKTTSQASNDSILNTLNVQSSIELKQKGDYELSTSEKAILRAVERANKVRTGDSSHVEYSVHKPHGDILIKVVNSETKEVIHEYPPEKILDLIDKLEEINGTIIDEKR